ncbi:MAG TPA: hypothetical protein VJT82_02080 [Pyrinomonadaceae bacterium]|nr:hypothetical protein [Pyrinomonadaceae bacterium]
MQRRQITLEDGRYLIFYTFDEETAASSNSANSDVADDDANASARRDEPRDVEPQAEEERRV